jgi:hypothetical protein
MPRFSEAFQDDRHYVFPHDPSSDAPKDKTRALRAFWTHQEAQQWAKNNLVCDFTIAWR